MEKCSKRRVLSLSLSQQGKDRKLSRRKKSTELKSGKDSAGQRSLSLESPNAGNSCCRRSEQAEEPKKNILTSSPITLTKDVGNEHRPEAATGEQQDRSPSAVDTLIVTVKRDDLIKKHELNQRTEGQLAKSSTTTSTHEGKLQKELVKKIAMKEFEELPKGCKECTVSSVHIETCENSREDSPGPGYVQDNKKKSIDCTENVGAKQNSCEIPFNSGNSSADTETLHHKDRASADSHASTNTFQEKCGQDEPMQLKTLFKKNLDIRKIVTDSLSNNSTPPFYSSDSEASGKETQVKLQCPLCWKMFEKQQTQASHMKSCALKKGLTTNQLLEALELQQKQAAERRALGLPGMPFAAPFSKKAPASRKVTRTCQSHMDSNLQLALALSLSLQSNGLEQTCEESSSKGEQNVIPFDTFGFTRKPVLAAVNPRLLPSGAKGKGKGKGKVTPVLLTRTADERQRIITEKVAMILMEETDINVGQVHDSSISVQPESDVLQQYYNKEKVLWVKSSVSPSKVDKTSYYVDDLRDFVSPSTVEAGSKVLHLSQVPCRVRTPPRNQKDEEEKSVILTSDCGSSSPSEFLTSTKSSHRESSSSTSHLEMELRAKLFSDWAGMVNTSVMSDLVIFPREGREIPAHKIVLLVRCPDILKDVVKQQNSVTGHTVEVIIFSRVPHAAVLAFLEYIYCGSVKSIPDLSDDLSCIHWLAKRYNVLDLLKYLRIIQKTACKSYSKTDIISQKKQSVKSALDFRDEVENNSSVVREDFVPLPLHQRGNRPRESIDMFDEASVSPPQISGKSDNESIYSQQTIGRSENQSRSGSPDLFENDCLEESSSAQQENNLDRLVSLIEKMTTPSHTSEIPNDVLSGTVVPAVDSTLRELLQRNSQSPPSPTLSQCSAVTEKINFGLQVTSPTFAELPVQKNEVRLSSGSKRRHSSTSSSLSDSECKKQKSECSDLPRAEALHNQVEVLDLTQDSEPDVQFPIISERFSDEGCADKVNILSSCSDASANEFSHLKSNCDKNKSVRDMDGKDTSLEPGQEQVILRTATKELSPVKKTSVGDRIDNKVRKNNCLSKEGIGEIDCPSSLSTDFLNETPQEGIDCPLSKDYGEPYISPVWDGFEDMNYENPFMNQLSPTPPEPLAGVSLSSPRRCRRSFSPRPGSSSGNDNQISEKCDEQLNLTVEGKYPANIHNVSGSSSDGDITPHQISVKSTVHEKKPNNSIGDMLDDSLNDALSESILQRAEKDPPQPLTQRETKGTPVNRVLSVKEDNVTPLANYSAMKTPQLKRELQKYGLKPSLGKRKGKLMLRHIYNELHPWVPVENPNVKETIHLSQSRGERDRASLLPLSQPSVSTNISPRKQIIPLQKSNDREFSDNTRREKIFKRTASSAIEDVSYSSSDSESSTSNTSIAEESRFLEEDGEEFEPLSQGLTQPTCKDDLPSVVFSFIMSDKDLHQKVLQYEPIWIEQLRADLKTKGFKFKMADLMGYLDEQCITFRTTQSGSRTKKIGRKNRKATKPHGSKSKGNLIQSSSEVED